MQIYAEAESNASVVAIAEAIQYMWRQPNNAEAESNASVVAIAEAQQYMWRKCLFMWRSGQNVQADCQIPQDESDDSA